MPFSRSPDAPLKPRTKERSLDEDRFFAKRMKATTTELSASHLPMLSQPKAVATVIMDAAAKAAGASR
jgi:hypothetical protein